jgi:hypothetical protein
MREVELMMVIRRKGALHNRAGCGEVNRKLVRDGWVLDIGYLLRREQYARIWPFWSASLATSGASDPTGTPRSRSTL